MATRKTVVKKATKKIDPAIQKVLDDNQKGILLDIGCGNDKQPGFVGMDYYQYGDVDIVWDITKFPWPLPDESVSCIMVSHLMEHITKASLPTQLVDLAKLLVKKKVITQKELDDNVGEMFFGGTLMRLMNEMWRVLKPNGQLMMVYPYAGSTGFWQDPTHVSGINEITWAYFDPLEVNTQGQLYSLYEPKPWKIDYNVWNPSQNMEVCLIKRKEDRSYIRPEHRQ